MPKAQTQEGSKLNEEQDLQSAALIGHVQKQCAIVNIFGVNILELIFWRNKKSQQGLH